MNYTERACLKPNVGISIISKCKILKIKSRRGELTKELAISHKYQGLGQVYSCIKWLLN